jgi:hypothetical protein
VWEPVFWRDCLFDCTHFAGAADFTFVVQQRSAAKKRTEKKKKVALTSQSLLINELEPLNLKNLTRSSF